MARSNTGHYWRNVHARRRANAKAEKYTQASPVKVTRPDGTVDERPAYTEKELKQILSSTR